VERAEIERVLKRFSGAAPQWPARLQEVVMGEVKLEEVAARLSDPQIRRLAYEMAVCVCEADEALNDAERAFLARVREVLDLPADAAEAFGREAEQLAAPPVLSATAPLANTVNDQLLERKVLNYAILSGALELLPETLATMGIIPLQVKMVYEIGKDFGYTLDRGHIKDFAATAGVGLTSQVVEGFATKLISRVLGRGFGRALTDQAVSSAFSFATTYALGHAARQYYAGGRALSAIELKGLFGRLLEEGKSLQNKYLPEIRQRAQQINVRQLLPLVRGGSV
jgi:uncharacterized protein (DUF697 family)